MALLLPRATLDKWRSPVSIATILFHIGALFSVFFLTWQGAITYLVVYYLTGCIGITFGYHRLLSHKSFKTNRVLKYIATIFGAWALEGGPIWWCAHHRLHHRESDQPMDPHSPKESFLWSHVLWFQFNHPDLEDYEALCSYVPDLAEDPVIAWIERNFLLVATLLNATLWVIGYLVWGTHVAWSMLFMGGFLRTVAVWHATWLVNSATHTWGYKSYESGDDSLNNWWVALVSFGEGWHNNHHALQRAARSGHRWWEVDPTYWHIALFKTLNWVWDVVPVNEKRSKQNLTIPVTASKPLSKPKEKVRA